MGDRFEEVFQRVVGHEGGYVCDARDPGGETKYGITWKTLRRAQTLGVCLVPATVQVKTLELEHARAIYRKFYWDEIRGDDLPRPVDEFTFDYAVNSGVERAAMALQAAAGALQDGDVGEKTIAAVRGKRPLDLVRIMFVERAMTFALNPNDKTFGRGWFARLFDLTVQALRTPA